MEWSLPSVQVELLSALPEASASSHLIFPWKSAPLVKGNWLAAAASFGSWDEGDHCFLDKRNQMGIRNWFEHARDTEKVHVIKIQDGI